MKFPPEVMRNDSPGNSLRETVKVYLEQNRDRWYKPRHSLVGVIKDNFDSLALLFILTTVVSFTGQKAWSDYQLIQHRPKIEYITKIPISTSGFPVRNECRRVFNVLDGPMLSTLTPSPTPR